MALQTKTYSVGSFDRYSGTSNGYILDLILAEESADVTANKSRVSYKLQLRSGPSNRFDWEFTARVLLNGVQVAIATKETFLDYNSTWLIISGQEDIPHNADGSMDMVFSATISPWNGGNSYTPPTLTVDGTLPLTAIARASTVAATPAFIGDASTIVVARKDQSYTHTIEYKFGSMSGYLTSATGETSSSPAMLSDTTILFPLPIEFYSQIPDSPSDVCHLTCTTYSNGEQIGDPQTAEFTVTADPARCSPIINGAVVDINAPISSLTGSNRRLISGVSTAQCSFVASARYNAFIVAVYINSVQVEGSPHIIPGVTESPVIVAEDSRGYTVRFTDPSVVIVPYSPVTFSMGVNRTDPTSGGAILTAKGKWTAADFGAAANVLTTQCRVAGGQWQPVTPAINGEDFTVSAQLSGLDYRYSHTVELQISDSVGTISKSGTVSKGIPVFDWGENDFAFHVPVRFVATDGTEFTLDLVDGQLIAVL